MAAKKNLCASYLFCILFGWLGLHHFYLGRTGWGLTYLFSLGLLGWGWFCDIVRMPCLVGSINDEIEDMNQGHPTPPQKRLDDAYILVLPFGWLGLHHYYLERVCWGILYTFTFGLFGIGWIIDIIRMPCLVGSVNEDLRHRYTPQATTAPTTTVVITTQQQQPPPPQGAAYQYHSQPGYPPPQAAYPQPHGAYPPPQGVYPPPPGTYQPQPQGGHPPSSVAYPPPPQASYPTSKEAYLSGQSQPMTSDSQQQAPMPTAPSVDG